MKKTYIIPETSTEQVHCECILAISGVASNNDIVYGGVDVDGVEDPDVKADIFDYSFFE